MRVSGPSAHRQPLRLMEVLVGSPMTESVHGHEILEHIIAAGGTMQLAALKEYAGRQFGAEATYHTCSANGMLFDELLGFLLQRHKVAVADGRITVHVENMCKSGESHGH